MITETLTRAERREIYLLTRRVRTAKQQDTVLDTLAEFSQIDPRDLPRVLRRQEEL